MLRKRKPPSAAKAQTAVTVAPANGALAKNRGSTSGSATRRSQSGKATSAASAAAARARISGEVQPLAGPSMIAAVPQPSSTTISSCPTGSSRRGRGERDSGTKRAVSRIAASATGTLIRKIDGQPAPSTRKPPSSGPSAIEMPTTPPQTPIARARSLGSVKVLVMIDIATGLSIEPPTACSARNATSHSRLGARLHSSEPSAKHTSPVWNTRRRPNRSATEPNSINSEASTRV